MVKNPFSAKKLEMSFGQRQPFCAGKLYPNNIKRSFAQMGMVKNSQKLISLVPENRKIHHILRISI